MRKYLLLLLVAVVLVTAACVEPEVTNTTETTAPLTVITTAAADTPVQTPTPVPVAVAFLGSIQCGVGDRSDTTYHCNGNVRIQGGGAHVVQVISRYADNNTFYSGMVDLGGQNPILMPFAVFPDVKYKGEEPKYFVKVDGVTCPVTWNGGSGTAWANLPG